jgi:hypothetical protein
MCVIVVIPRSASRGYVTGFSAVGRETRSDRPGGYPVAWYHVDPAAPSGRITSCFWPNCAKCWIYPGRSRRSRTIVRTRMCSSGTCNSITWTAPVLSAKQQQRRAKRKRGHGTRGTAAWDDAMFRARGQAEQYARALPTDERRPPLGPRHPRDRRQAGGISQIAGRRQAPCRRRGSPPVPYRWKPGLATSRGYPLDVSRRNCVASLGQTRHPDGGRGASLPGDRRACRLERR